MFLPIFVLILPPLSLCGMQERPDGGNAISDHGTRFLHQGFPTRGNDRFLFQEVPTGVNVYSHLIVYMPDI